ncbi:MAG TPA: CDP-alcohol phosphatidyltransferase family protein [Candidatus Eisenbacteria bacterium]
MFVEEYLVDLRREGYTPAAWRRYVDRSFRLARESAFERPAMLRSIALAGVLGFLVLLGVSLGAAFVAGARLSVEIFSQCGLMLLAGVAIMAGHVRLLVRPDGTAVERINPANLLTLSRLVAIPAMLALVRHGFLPAALLTFLLGGFTDVLDGWLARRRGDATDFGRIFDPIVDIAFHLAIFLALHAVGLIPDWVLVLVLLRYGLLAFGAVGISVFRGPVEIRPTVLGKTTGVVMTMLVAMLVAGRLTLPSAVSGRIETLIVLAIGFVEAITIPQVLLIGWYNFRKAGRGTPPVIALVSSDEESARRLR